MSTIRKRIPTDYLVIESFSCYGISLWPQFNLRVLFVVKMKTINHHGNFFKDTYIQFIPVSKLANAMNSNTNDDT